MNKKLFLFSFVILLGSVLCFDANNFNSFTSKFTAAAKPKNTQIKTIRCNNCPCNCLIKPNQAGECGQYKNINGKLVSVKN